jgi:hypothetical protein
MSLYIVDIHGDIEGDYEIVRKYENEEPFINKPCISKGVCEHDKNAILDRIRAEIAEYGSICVEYKLTLTDRRDKDIEQLVTDVIKQAKKQVLDVIDKYKSESEDQG